MVARDWNGGTGDWADPMRWTTTETGAQGAPQPGDKAMVSSGDVEIVGAEGLDGAIYNGIAVTGRLASADHDTITLPSADVRSLAAVLRDTGDVSGSAVITDPKTGDTIGLAGVTTAELKAHPKDFGFGA